MAASVSVIGRAARVHGRVTGDADVEVQGFVEGEITVGGDVTVDTGGMVGAGVRGRRVVVRGAVRGDLVGEEGIVLEEGARVVGDVRAPRVHIAAGALVRGYVDTGDGGEGPVTIERPQTAARPAAARPAGTSAAAAPTRAAPPPPRAQAKAAPPPAPPPVAPPPHVEEAPRRPPPPVVPVIRKAKGQIAKKKER